MAKKNSRNTKGRIISAAWKLFYEQGYEETTVEDIVFESGTSKGSFTTISTARTRCSRRFRCCSTSGMKN